MKKNSKQKGKKKGGNPGNGICPHCQRSHAQKPDDCWSLEKNKSKHPEWYQKLVPVKSQKDKFDAAVMRQVKKAAKEIKKSYKKKYAKKRHILEDSSEEDAKEADAYVASLKAKIDNSDTSSSEESFSYFPSCYAFNKRSKKRRKLTPPKYTAEIVVQIEDQYGNVVPIRGLLDTGTSDTIILRDFVRKGRAKGYKGHPTVWNTMGGEFVTKQMALIDFKFPELNHNDKVTWITHVDHKTNKDDALYDMIIGMDLMTEIGIYINTATKEVCGKEMLSLYMKKEY